MAFPGVTVIVGAGSGIGRASAQLFVQRGCTKIAIGDVNAEGLNETKRLLLDIDEKVQVVNEQCDVTSEESVESFIAKAASTFGRIDHALNVAGILRPGASNELDTQTFDLQFNINTRGMWLCQRAEIMQMQKQDPIQLEGSPSPVRGTIANVASMAALRGYDRLASYCTSKFAILGFTKSDALRHGAEHIRINAVCPGLIQTPMTANLQDGDVSKAADLSREMAMARPGQPSEVAEGLYWLSSPRSSFVTGISLPINGGMIGA